MLLFQSETAIKVCTFNCCSLNKNIDVVRKITKCNNDLVFPQETLVPENRIGDLAFIEENYECIGSPAVYSEKALSSCSGRCEGGLACMWPKNVHFKIDNIKIRKDFIVMSILYNGVIIGIVNLYIRSDL